MYNAHTHKYTLHIVYLCILYNTIHVIHADINTYIILYSNIHTYKYTHLYLYIHCNIVPAQVGGGAAQKKYRAMI